MWVLFSIFPEIWRQYVLNHPDFLHIILIVNARTLFEILWNRCYWNCLIKLPVKKRPQNRSAKLQRIRLCLVDPCKHRDRALCLPPNPHNKYRHHRNRICLRSSPDYPRTVPHARFCKQFTLSAINISGNLIVTNVTSARSSMKLANNNKLGINSSCEMQHWTAGQQSQGSTKRQKFKIPVEYEVQHSSQLQVHHNRASTISPLFCTFQDAHRQPIRFIVLFE